MASAAFNRWDRAGRPFELATPIQEIQAWAEANGVPVLGTIGNDEHLEAATPQDHTPFSATWWPVELDGWMITAIDLENVTRNGVTLGYAIEGQARAGDLPWFKYMNHAGRHLDVRDLDGDGIAFEVYPSSDQHVHLSINTLWQRRPIGAFNPFGGSDMTPQETDELLKLVRSMAGRTEAIAKLTDSTTWTGMPYGVQEEMKGNQLLKVLAADITELKSRPPMQPAPVDPAAVNAAVLAAMQNPAVLAKIAKAVTDEIGS